MTTHWMEGVLVVEVIVANVSICLDAFHAQRTICILSIKLAKYVPKGVFNASIVHIAVAVMKATNCQAWLA